MVIYDFEVFRHDWCVVWLDTDTRKYYNIVNDKRKLESFYKKYRNTIMVGYNSNHYDKYILQGILCGFDPYDISDWIIQKERQGWQYSSLLREFPIINYDCMINRETSLKKCECGLGMRIVESSVPFDIKRKLTPKEMKEVLKYCQHDVKATFEVFMLKGFPMSPQDEFMTSVGIIKEFGFPIEWLAKTKAQLGVAVIGAKKGKRYDDEFDIMIPKNVILGKYQHVAEWFTNPDNHWYKGYKIGKSGKKVEVKNEFKTIIAGIEHTLAWGGIHGSVEKKTINGRLLMCDFASLYPNIMINYGLISRGVTSHKKFIELVMVRLELKAKGDPKEKNYKIPINGAYGQMGFEQSAMYDKKMANNVCVHGQLIAVDLVDKLESHGAILNTNTDGVLIQVFDDESESAVRKICKEVGDRLKIKIDIEEYTRFVVKDVNNYVAVKPNGKYKAKGSYVKDLKPYEYSLNIVNKALREYFINDVPVEETISTCQNLRDFQIIAKAGRKYSHVLYGGRKINEKTNRVFASMNQSRGGLEKVKKEDASIARIEMTPEHCLIINEDIREYVSLPQELDKQWYIDLANRRVNDFKGIKTKRKKALT